MSDKVIVTNAAALTAKYNASGLTAIRKALKALLEADRKRGIETQVVELDDPQAMKKLKGTPVRDVGSARQNKAAIDAVYRALTPDYLMILGATDVVPHQDPRNPAFEAGDDTDDTAYGDLPYACDQAYGRDPAKFIGPTRVVARLPDLTGAKKPDHLLRLLKTAAGAKARAASDYAAYFGLSANVWQGSTRLSLEEVFGTASKLRLSPKTGPKHPGGALGARMHFINCHGADSSPEFYGQKGESFPVALTSGTIKGAIVPGTVAAVECCFGAQLYDAETLSLGQPICQSYLAQGALAYLGSTTIAYGPADENGAADLLCQYFLLSVLAGESIGNALLLARQRFVNKAAQLDPIDLKTLAQFCLYGDPSVRPVLAPSTTMVATQFDNHAAERFRRKERRAKSQKMGEFLRATKATASRHVAGARPQAAARRALANIAAAGGLGRAQPFVAYAVQGGKQSRGGKAAIASAPSRYYLTIGKRRGGEQSDFDSVAILAKEVGGRIVDYRVYERR